MNRQQKRRKTETVYSPVMTPRLSMQKELNEKLSLATLNQLEKEVSRLMDETLIETFAPMAERIHKMDWAVMFRVLIDRYDFDKDKLADLFEIANSYLDDVGEGRLNLDEMCETLYNEDDISISWKLDMEAVKA